jgi:tetratricopeptide (TPR) repeat protein
VSPGLTDRLSLAVFYFQNITGDDSLEWLKTGLTDMLVTDLSQSPNLRVLSMERLYQILDETDALQDEQISFESVQDVAKRAGIGTAVLGSFVKAGDVLRINVSLQDASSGEVLSSERIEGDGEAAVFSMVDDLTRRIRRRLALASLQEDQVDRDLVSVTTDSVEAYRYFVEGVREHQNANERQAIRLLEKAIELDPNFAMALAKLSVAHGNTGDHVKAKEFAELSLQHIERLSDRERYYIEGRFYSLDPETHDRAIEAYSKAVELYADHQAARNNMAQLLMGKKRFGEAVTHLERLLADGMTFYGTYASLAEAYTALDESEKGTEVLRRFVDLNPGKSVGYVNLGEHLMRWERYDEAIEAFRRAKEIDPESRYFELWDAFVLTNRWTEARAVAAELQRTNGPMNWVGYAYEAILELYFGRYKESQATLEEGMALFGDNPVAGSQLPQIMVGVAVRAGRPEAAIELAEKLVSDPESDSDYQGALWAASLASIQIGQKVQGERYADRFLATLKPGHEDSSRAEQTFLGFKALEEGRFHEALASFEKAVKNLPDRRFIKQSSDYADVWFGLGLARWELDERRRAADWFSQLVESKRERMIAPTLFVLSHYYLGRYHEEIGESDAAMRYYKAFLGFWEDGDIDRDLVKETQDRLSSLRSPAETAG